MSLESLPFHELSSSQIRSELWPGVQKWFDPLQNHWPKSRDRGNYVKSYVHSRLRIEAKAERLRVTWNLDALWAYLPNELISAIFGLLHPLDLYHAIRSTKSLRYFLLDKQSLSIWKESFMNHPDIPLYPNDVSPPKWVSLMFGPATCDTCGRDNCLVEYALRIRQCNDCSDYYKRANDKIQATIRSVFSQSSLPHSVNDDIWRLAVETNRYSSFFYPEEKHYNRPPKYSIRQITEVAQEIRAVLLGKKDTYETFLALTETANREIVKHAINCNVWAREICSRSLDNFGSSLAPFCEMASTVLARRGHNPMDVEVAKGIFALNIYHRWYKVADARLGKSKLLKYLPMIEWMTQECKSRRIVDTCNERIALRKREVREDYYDIVKNYPTSSSTLCMPQPETIFQDAFFAAYIGNPREPVSLNYTLTKQHVLRIINDFVTTKKRRLFELLLHAGVLPREANDCSDPEGFLGLAVAVFECCNKVWFGWEEAGSHLCRISYDVVHLSDARDSSFHFRFSDMGCQVLRGLAELLHIHSFDWVVPGDLDTLNKRFVCKSCSLIRKAGVLGQLSLTWRECLGHAIGEQHRNDKNVAQFDILSDTLTTHSLFLEQPFPQPTDHVWTCTHCLPRRGSLTRLDAIKHAYDSHNVSNATVGIDFTIIRENSSPSRVPLFVGLDQNVNHRCLRCPRSHKLWTKGEKTPDMYLHFLNKHNVESQDLIEGVDWVKIQAVEDDTWVHENIQRSRQAVIS